VTRHTVLFVSYCVWAIVVTSVHNLYWLALNFFTTTALIFLSNRNLSWRVYLPLSIFNGVLTGAYALALWFGWYSGWEPILRLNLRTFGLLGGTLLFVTNANPFKIFPRAVRWNTLLVLVLSQIFQYRRLWEEFQMALKSRTIINPSWRQRFNHTLRLALYFFLRALYQGEELSLGLQSRGFHLD